MALQQHNPDNVFPPYANYAHAVEVSAGSRLLFVSGLNGYEDDGESMPADFEGQAELTWTHLETILSDADMSISNLVSLRFYLASAADDPANVAVLRRRLGDHHAARTVVCAGMLEPGWLLEIEAVAAALPVSVIADATQQEDARVIVGHSVGSIVASLAASRPGSGVETVLSIEGNLTLADAYFSGSAAGHSSPSSFRQAFLARLDGMATDNPTLARYRDQVALADPQSVWELGRDTHRWSLEHHPGEVLAASAPDVQYLYNPANTSADSLEWLSDQSIVCHQMDGASHWKAVDQPESMARHLLAAPRRREQSPSVTSVAGVKVASVIARYPAVDVGKAILERDVACVERGPCPGDDLRVAGWRMRRRRWLGDCRAGTPPQW